MFFGKYWVKDQNLDLKDVKGGKLLIFIPLLIFIVLLGIMPSLLTDIFNPAINELMKKFVE